jgi:large conductance mechanosensitive channel
VIAEFREFINRGNTVEMAVAFVLGLSFRGVIAAITDRVFTPLVAMAFGEPNFDALLTFGDVDPETGVPAGSVGAVLTSLVDFLLVAFVLFFVVKGYNRMQHKAEEVEEAEPGPDPDEVVLLREIRDQLRSESTGGNRPTA